MKTKLLFTLFIIASIAKAQIPVIDFSIAPNIGDNYTSRLDTIAEHLLNVLPGDGGENVIWDFSSQIDTTGPMIVRNLVSPTIYQMSGAFPSSNVSNVGADNNPDFYTINNQGILFNGSIISNVGTNYVLLYDNPITNFIFPTTYLNNFVDTFHGSYPSFPSYLQINGTFSSNCDGYGTLILPYGNTYQNVLRIKHNYFITNTITESGVTRIDTTTEEYYDWIGEDITYPILAIGTRTVNLADSANDIVTKYIRIKTGQNLTANTSSANANSLSIYPNPTTGNCYVSLPVSNQTYQIVVYDMLGKIISKENVMPTNSHLINLENCNKGIYFVSINNSNFNTTLKVSKQ